LSQADRRAVSIEVGIQNSGLGLILVFNFFGGLGGMAITAAWWGIWHVLAGLALASWWRRRPPATAGAVA
jgi:BASS family bile acid:Na+ symporter